MTLQQAISQVTEVYLHLHGKMQKKRLIHTVQSAPDRVSDWIPLYLERVKARDVKTETLAVARRYLVKVEPVLGHLAISVITTRHIADYLATLAGTPRTQQATRSVLLDFFREAIAAGWRAAIAAGWRADKPVAPTRSERVETQRGRLSLEHFKAIHRWSAANQPAWATRAIELAIVTAQRRADIAAMLFSQTRDGHLWIEQGKGGAKVAIPLGLRLDAVGLTVGDVVARCRDGVLSRRRSAQPVPRASHCAHGARKAWIEGSGYDHWTGLRRGARRGRSDCEGQDAADIPRTAQPVATPVSRSRH